MVSHKSVTKNIPNKKQDEANWLAVQRAITQLQNPIVCVGATGDPGTIASGSPGAYSTVTWTPPTNVTQDANQMILPNATSTSIRIPADGYYNFWLRWDIKDRITASTQLECLMLVATTSDTGFGSPVFNALYDETDFFGSNNQLDDVTFLDYRGIEFHANDLVQFQVRLYGSQALTNTKVGLSEFRFSYPIPSQVPA